MVLLVLTRTPGRVRTFCGGLELPRSAFYQAGKVSTTAAADRKLGDLIEEIFNRHRSRYGYRRILQEMSDHGVVCAPARVRRIMKFRGLRAIQPKNYVPKTSDGKANQPSPNLLATQPPPTQPNQVWTGDFTFIPTATRWLFLAVVMDLYSRRIVGWSLETHMRAGLVVGALNQALQTRRLGGAILFHSDRGSQYGSRAFRDRLKESGFRQSMSALAYPYDNAWTESFIGTLKREMLQGGSFENAEDARMEIFDYIEGYYNPHRKHSAIGYQTPIQFEIQKRSLN